MYFWKCSSILICLKLGKELNVLKLISRKDMPSFNANPFQLPNTSSAFGPSLVNGSLTHWNVSPSHTETLASTVSSPHSITDFFSIKIHLNCFQTRKESIQDFTYTPYDFLLEETWETIQLTILTIDSITDCKSNDGSFAYKHSWTKTVDVQCDSHVVRHAAPTNYADIRCFHLH